MVDTNDKKFDQRGALLQYFGEAIGPDTKILLMAMVGQEAISTPFKYQLRLMSLNEPLHAENHLGTQVRIGIRQNTDKQNPEYKSIDGFVSRFHFLEKLEDALIYEVEMVPGLWYLQREITSRIFQNLTVVQILDKIFRSNPFTSKGVVQMQLESSEKAYPKLEYCVQYRESTLAFVSRLMEEYGISYYFKHPQDHTSNASQNVNRTTMVLTDRNAGFTKLEPFKFTLRETPNPLDAITSWREVFDLRTRTTTLADYDFKKPRISVRTADATAIGPRSLEGERFDYPAGTVDRDHLQERATRQAQEEGLHQFLIDGAGTARQFRAGFRFEVDLAGRSSDVPGKEFVISAVQFAAREPQFTDKSFWEKFKEAIEEEIKQGGKSFLKNLAKAIPDIGKNVFTGNFGGVLGNLGGAFVDSRPEWTKDAGGVQKWMQDKLGLNLEQIPENYHMTFVCIPFAVPIRPPRVTPKPRVYGPHTAIVVGPKDEEIHTDEFGRVCVRFHWDRRQFESTKSQPDPQGLNKVEEGFDTVFMRVSQGWAGKEYGMQFLPRVNQEVIVDFLEGDPDCPIVTGRFYHGTNKHAYELTKFKTRSGLKTNSTPTKEGDRGGFHMLRFEDQRGKEQILMRSQRRMDVRALASYYETTHANRHMKVGFKDEDTDESGGSLFVTAGGEYDLHANKDFYKRTDTDHYQSSGSNLTLDVGSSQKNFTKSTLEVNAMKIVIEAKTKISLKVGGSFVVIDPAGVHIVGPMVRINSGGAADACAPTKMGDPVDATIADNGEPGYLEKLLEYKGGGGSRWRTLNPQHGPVVTRNADGSYQFSKGVKVKGDPDYAAKVINDLTTMTTTKEGQKVIDSLDSSGKQTTIQNFSGGPPNPPNAFAAPGGNTAADYQKATPAGQPVFFGDGSPANDASGNQLTGTGTGGDSVVSYDPNQWPSPTTASKAPGDVILFHELNHSDNQTHGRYDGTPRTDGFTTNEEFNAIGPENRYRDERGVPRRTNHGDL